MQTVFVNPERCIGCRQCEVACAVEHSESREAALAPLEVPLPRTRIHVEGGEVATTSFPNKCRHCDPAPCLQVCPTGAITRDDELGLVLVDATRCIGCAMCAVVCPFDVLTFYPLAGGPDAATAVAVKCDGCIDRLGRSEIPACAEACKTDALVFGELNELAGAGRIRQTATVLAAASQAPAMTQADPLQGWHAFGQALHDVADVAAADGARRTNGQRAPGVATGPPSEAATQKGGAP